MSLSSKLLRVPRPGNKDPPFILLHVSASSADSLSLTLRATEGERAFGTSLQRAGLDACRQKSFNGTLDELETILRYLFLGAPADTTLVRGTELSAVIHGTGIQLSVRKDVGGIKQKLAQLTIPEAEVEIPIFEWAAESCVALESLSNKANSQHSQTEKQQTTIEKLTQQVETLTTIKKEHEEMLLIKFKNLLNEKKAKIRELDLLIGTTESIVNSADKENDKKVAVQVRTESPPARRGRSSRGKKTAPSRASTRTTRKRRQAVESPSGSDDDGPAQMEVDSPPKSSTIRTTRQNKEKAAVVAAASPPELGQPEVDATASDDDQESRMSDSRTSEDELPPMRKPVDFFIKPTNSASVEPKAQGQGQETSDRPKHGADSDEDDEL